MYSCLAAIKVCVHFGISVYFLFRVQTFSLKLLVVWNLLLVFVTGTLCLNF